MNGACKLWRNAKKEALGQAHFRVAGEPSSQFLMRIFGLFAQQHLLPENATVRNLDSELVVRMKTPLISRHRAGIIAEKMSSLVDTHCVQISWSTPRAGGANTIDRPGQFLPM